MVFPDPLRVTLPGPPERWVKAPVPKVARSPATTRLVLLETVIPAPVIIKLLKLLAPLPLTRAPLPLSVTNAALLNVPSLVQFPPTECEKVLPSKVVEAPSTTLPRTVRGAWAANETEVPVPTLLLSVPASVSGLYGIVFTAAPPLLLSVRLP